MSKVQYLDENDIFTAFDLVKQEFDRKYDKVPEYERETEAVEELKSLIERLTADQYYPNLKIKASNLFINTIKSHYFSNGNKRLGIVITIIFLIKNDLGVKELDKQKHKSKLKNLFPNYNNFYDEEEFTSTDFGFYNLAKIIASNKEIGVKLETLKDKTRSFFRFCYR